MTVLALVFGAAILLTWMLVHSYSRRAGMSVSRRVPARHADRGDTWWMFAGSDGSASDCSPGDAGGSCGDGGGGGD